MISKEMEMMGTMQDSRELENKKPLACLSATL